MPFPTLINHFMAYRRPWDITFCFFLVRIFLYSKKHRSIIGIYVINSCSRSHIQFQFNINHYRPHFVMNQYTNEQERKNNKRCKKKKTLNRWGSLQTYYSIDFCNLKFELKKRRKNKNRQMRLCACLDIQKYSFEQKKKLEEGAEKVDT